jgi:hypothetical protein
MDINSVIFSDELREIINQASTRAIEKSLAEVSLESVQLYILKKYIYGTGAGRALRSLIDRKIQKEDYDSFIQEVEEAVDRSEHYMAKKTYLDSSDTPELNDALCRVIERVNITLDIVKGSARDLGLSESTARAIDTETFFTAMFFEGTNVNSILKRNGMDNTALLEDIQNLAMGTTTEPTTLEQKLDTEDMPEDKKDDEESAFEDR